MFRSSLAWVSQFGDRVWVGVALLALAVLSQVRDAGVEYGRPFGVGSAVMLALGVAMLLGFGRRWPASVAAGAIALTLAWYALDHASSAINVVTLAAFYNLGVAAPRGRAALTLSLALVVTIVAMVAVGDQPATDAVGASGWITSATLLGALVRQRRLVIEEAERRAAAAEATREAEAERRANEARVEIARDLHDLLAHAVVVMSVQAGVAAEALDDDPATARRAIDEVRRAGRDAMTEVESLVRVLRDPAGPRAPAPSVAQIGSLVERVVGSECSVDLDIDLDATEIPEMAGLTIYRVVQESLTNVLRHSHADHVGVVVCARDGHVEVEVTDDGSRDGSSAVDRDHGPDRDGVPSSHDRGRARAGVGLLGMRERVDSMGGSVVAGPGRGGGWTVRARIPLGVSGP